MRFLLFDIVFEFELLRMVFRVMVLGGGRVVMLGVVVGEEVRAELGHYAPSLLLKTLLDLS